MAIHFNQMQRRDFIKHTCGLCMAVGTGTMITALSSCSSLPIYKTISAENKISVPVFLFENSSIQIVRSKGFEYDIALQKNSNQNYTAFEMRCTHADNQIAATGNGFTCLLHGSKFNNQGIVTKGPAEQPLKKYTTEILNNHIIIHLN